MIEFGTLTRATGKVFVGIYATVPQDGRIIGRSQCTAGNEVPAVVVTKDAEAGEYVLIIPSLAGEQTVELAIYDGQGNEVESVSRRFGHLHASLTSKYNTFRKVHGLEDIRKFDETGVSDEAFVRIDRMGIFEDRSELVHAYISVPCTSKDAADAKMRIHVLDRRGREVPIRKLTVLKDSIEPVVKGSDTLARFIEVSVHYETPQFYLTLWVSFEGDALPAGFTGLELEQTKTFRDQYFKLYENCGFGPRYEEWFKKVHQTPKMVLDAQRSVSFEIEPSFSFIVPLFKTPLDFLEDMIKSVLDQTYTKFELVLVNASPEDADLCAVIREYAAHDERVKIVTLERNMDIALNTDAGIKAATGDFLCFLDHDDFIEPDLLYHYVKVLNKQPETDMLYCDEDKYRDGHFVDGFLKPDFDWELLAAINYVCHMLAVRRSVVEKIDLSDSEVSGAQDWDMSYKIAEQARNIFHVRKVLYHWRIHDYSTAKDSDAKPYTHKASEKVIQNHFDRIGLPVTVEDGPFTNSHAVNYKLPDELPLISIIIPTKDYINLLSRCIDSIYEKSSYGNFEIIVVENNSTQDETFEYYKKVEAEHENLKVVRFEGGFNFSAICNLGAKNASGDYYLFLNNDTEVITPDWLERLLGPMMRDDVACTGAKLLYPDETIQHAGVIIPKSPPGHVGLHFPRNDLFCYGLLQHPRELSAVTGACMLVKKVDFEAVDGFDEELAVAYNDVDLCLRLREAGKRIVIEPRAELFHYESASRGADDVDSPTRMRFTKEKGQFMMRWNRYIGEGDPMYSTNFAIAAGYCDLDWTQSPWGI